MGSKDMRVARAQRGLGEQAVACKARGFLDGGLRLLAAPGECAMRDAELPGDPLDGGGLARSP